MLFGLLVVQQRQYTHQERTGPFAFLTAACEACIGYEKTAEAVEPLHHHPKTNALSEVSLS